MPEPRIVFDRVWKKFRRGERHDSLRDLVPAMARRLFGRAPAQELREHEFWALRDVSFDVQAGTALGIIGPNGAGKSTSLKLLTRILRPTRGRCLARGRTGALIEVTAGFHFDLTGRENVFLQGAIMGMKRAETAARFDAIVDFAGIPDFIDTPVKRYSSGMAARLGFSIAAHLNPDALIIDEVLAVGDIAFQERCYQRMSEFKRDGVAIVFVSHNFGAIRQVCDRVGVLQSGQMTLFDDVASGIAAYSGNSLTPGQAGPAGASIAVLDVNGRAVSRARAGEPLQVVATMIPGPHESALSSSMRVRCIETNEFVYATTSPSVGTPSISPSASSPVEARWSLRANLARGHYAFEVALFETARRLPVASITSAPIAIDETETENAVVWLGTTCALSERTPRLTVAV